MSDYERIARIIRYINENRLRRPDLAELAAAAGLSPHHFHRLFQRWAGVTPKAFLRCLTADHARRLLAEGRDVLGTAHEVGLSGPGRLHDLCVALEAASPGEIKSGGAGLEIAWGLGDTPLGRALIAQTQRGICRLSFINADEAEEHDVPADLRAAWPAAAFSRDDPGARALLQRVFQSPPPPTADASGRQSSPRAGSGSPLRLFVRGTAFQVSVWRALLRIPPGALAGYGAVARAVGNPGASRAVGNAVGANPVAWLIPCHRVIRESGVVGNYRWGPQRKQAAIARESLSTSPKRFYCP